MSIELWCLLACVAVLWLSIVIQALNLDFTAGYGYTLGPRDDASPVPSVMQGRLTRNVRNQVEGLVLFAPLVAIAAQSGISNVWTTYAAVTYAATRALFVPAFAYGLVPWRSIIWGIGFFGALPAFVWGLVTA